LTPEGQPDPRYPSIESFVARGDHARPDDLGADDVANVRIGSLFAETAERGEIAVETLLYAALRYGYEHLPEAIQEHTRRVIDGVQEKMGA
jgi:hypothetical protein